MDGVLGQDGGADVDVQDPAEVVHARAELDDGRLLGEHQVQLVEELVFLLVRLYLVLQYVDPLLYRPEQLRPEEEDPHEVAPEVHRPRVHRQRPPEQLLRLPPEARQLRVDLLDADQVRVLGRDLVEELYVLLHVGGDLVAQAVEVLLHLH